MISRFAFHLLALGFVSFANLAYNVGTAIVLLHEVQREKVSKGPTFVERARHNK